MELVRYGKPDWTVARDLDHWVNGLFNLGLSSPANGRGMNYGHQWNNQDMYLAFDLYESDDAYHAVFELPGMKRKDIQVSIEGERVTISGQRKMKSGGEAQEISFQRSFTVPDGVALDAITAKYKNGMLALDIPKHEQRKPRSIAVK